MTDENVETRNSKYNWKIRKLFAQVFFIFSQYFFSRFCRRVWVEDVHNFVSLCSPLLAQELSLRDKF